jgi:ATP-binding cassette, subfamily B, multidrug efflux pump
MKLAIRILLPYMQMHRRGVALGVAALLFRNLFAAGIPIAIGSAVDRLSDNFQGGLALKFAIGLVALTAAKGVFQYWMRVILIGISRDVEYELRNELFSHLIRLSSNFFARFRTGDIMARYTNDLNAVRMMLGPGVMYTADTGLTALLAIIIMSSVDWRLTLFALLPAPFVTVMVIFFGRYVHMRFRKIQEIFADISSRVHENLSGVRVIRAYVQEEAELRTFDSLNEHYITNALQLAKVQGLFMPALQSFTALSFLIVLWYGGHRLLENQLSLGGFLMFNVFLGMLIWPMVAMGWVVNLMQRGSASLGRISELLDEEPAIADPPRPVPLPSPLQGDIRFENVSLRFGDRMPIRELDLHIEAGSTVAIVGHTGSGKSSIVNLIPRMHDPASGRVLLDGIDLRKLRVEDIRRAVGMVPQETFLFSATLSENIAFGAPGASDRAIEEAAERAGLAGDILDFPDGYDTIVGERGITLSGGQKQRTAIARAILRNPKILILDDALASVDTVTEEGILTALSDVMEGRTTILISHRVSTVQNADKIFVIENGTLAEQGDHESLLAADRWYADLYRRQLIEDELQSI